MARPAIEIVSDAKRKIDKARQRGDFRPAPFFDADMAAELSNPLNYGGNNKSEWIKKIGKGRRVYSLRNRNNPSHKRRRNPTRLSVSRTDELPPGIRRILKIN